MITLFVSIATVNLNNMMIEGYCCYMYVSILEKLTFTYERQQLWINCAIVLGMFVCLFFT